ncbi:uncharacterized protein LOC143353188 [Halictus rubicundus]|uniref:uncharacterized protein LOC143353188 n=1 Tax=Halictus rubicundus TaxID=77578 RepID=UPI004036879B
MSDVKPWTNLPKGMDQNFISFNGDYDYPLYISEKEEWVNYKNKNIKGRIMVFEPFLIMELNRLVPFLEDNYVRFHVLNMPHIVVKKIEIMGFVLSVSEDSRFHMYQVDDGTGSITIYYDKNHFMRQTLERKKIDEKYRDYAMRINSQSFKGHECPKRFPNPRPNFDYPVGTSIRDMAILEHKWSLETKNGGLGKCIQRCDYVHAVGYCALDHMFVKKPREDITFKDLSVAKLNFLATNVICIDDHEYNAKMYSWLYNVVRRRYDEHPDKPEFIPKDAT